jgi:CheY-like chemotaxis protein
MSQKDPMKKKILIVEDNNDSREILGLFVIKFGYQVIRACNSKEAITYAEAERPDLIFMDMDLPDVDGVKTIGDADILHQWPANLGQPALRSLWSNTR